MKSMKIVQINAVYQFSSTGRTTMEMHDFLQKENYDSYVFCTNYSDPIKKVFKIGCSFNYKLHAFLSRLFGLQGYFSFFSTYNLLKRFNDIKPDVVILRNLHSNYINIPILLNYLGKKNIATIVVLHDCWFFTGHCCHYTEDTCFKWRQHCSHCPILHKYNKSWFFDNSSKIFSDKEKFFSLIPRLSVVGVSDWISNEAKLSPIFKNVYKIGRIYNWIDLEIFFPRETVRLRRELGFTNEFVILGVAQSWSEKKGLSHFITLASHFQEAKILLVGELDKKFILPENIVSIGVITDANILAEYYSLADVFLNTSIQETFGKVAAEALACGTPLIVNDATANPEIVGECGFIVHNNNDSEIIQAVSVLMSRSKLYYTEKCVERAEKLFSKKKNLDLYINLIKELHNAR